MVVVVQPAIQNLLPVKQCRAIFIILPLGHGPANVPGQTMPLIHLIVRTILWRLIMSSASNLHAFDGDWTSTRPE